MQQPLQVLELLILLECLARDLVGSEMVGVVPARWRQQVMVEIRIQKA